MIAAVRKKMQALTPDPSLDQVMDTWNSMGAVPTQTWMNVSASNPMAQNYSASSLMLGNKG